MSRLPARQQAPVLLMGKRRSAHAQRQYWNRPAISSGNGGSWPGV